MKKYFALLLVVVIAGCAKKETIYKENLNGTWTVYQYLLYNVNKTQTFQNQHPNYSITFGSDGTYTEFETNPDSTYQPGTYHFTDNDEMIEMDYTTYTYSVDTLNDTIATPHNYKKKYTIFNLTKDHVQLRNDTSQLYMNKKTQ